MTTSPVTQVPVKELWEQQKKSLKMKFPNLTDDDLRFEENKKDEMLVNLSKKLGKTKEELAVFFTAQ
jgi:uncharacterized protein YjbJ (UPF0337 family)